MSCDCKNTVIVGCGAVSVDFLATVAAYPKPDDKIRSTSFKVADDTQGREVLRELEADGVDTSFMASTAFPELQLASIKNMKMGRLEIRYLGL
ncbi:hypothetical protein VNO80_10011 [Phaseolus coccineus]|uniref:Uncharacterized protein n=1 Tax=Phaseolus coccineus TaxID=3886 RepID=A0AAN9NCP3_PHACN